MNKPYSQKAVREGRKHWERERRHQADADTEAFHVGRIIWNEVLKRERAKRNSGAVVAAYAREIGISKSGAYDRKDFFLGCRMLENFRESKLPRQYVQTIGKICRDNSLFSYHYLFAFLDNPFTDRNGNTSVELLEEVRLLCDETRRKIWNPENWELEVFVEVPGTNPDGKPFRFPLTPRLPPREERKYDETMLTLIDLEFQISKRIGKPFRVTVLPHDDRWAAARPPTKNEVAESTSSKGMIRYARWGERLAAATSQATPEEMLWQKERVFHGKAEKILADPTKFFPRSIDVVVTDPPYGDDMYAEWRDHLKIRFDSPKSALGAAELVAKVARIMVKRELFKKQFAWFQFMPLKAVHLFVPPLLKAFEPLKPKYQLIVWDKTITPKIGGDELFSPQCEGIAYLTVGRPLTNRNRDGSRVGMHKAFLSIPPCRGEDGVYWKPISILKELIRLSTDADHEQAKRQVVLDPFGGSGSLGRAAYEMHRDFRLIESHPKQFAVCKSEVLELAKLGIKKV